MYELQYSTHVHRRPVCILLRQSLWRGWRGVRREGRKGGWWKWGTRKASQQCFITSNNIRNEVLVFICFNFLQMWKAECKHHHAYNALRCDVRQTRRFFFLHWKMCFKKSLNLSGLTQRRSVTFLSDALEFWENCFWGCSALLLVCCGQIMTENYFSWRGLYKGIMVTIDQTIRFPKLIF